MSNIQASETQVLYRIVLNKEHSLCFSTAGECLERYQLELLSGRRDMGLEVLTDKGWVGFNDPIICRWCRKPIGKEPHTQCHNEEDQAYSDYVAHQQTALMDLHW